jgi:hypothetical protein
MGALSWLPTAVAAASPLNAELVSSKRNRPS